MWPRLMALTVALFCAGSGLTAAAAAAPHKPKPRQAGTTITVNETVDSGTFDPPGPVYSSYVLDPSNHNGLCSLREAIEASNTGTAVDGCAPGGPGENTIVLPAGEFVVDYGFYVMHQTKFVGANAGKAGYDPSRGPETIVRLQLNPRWRAHPALFWLSDPLPLPGGAASGAGSEFDGIDFQGTSLPTCDDSPSPTLPDPCDLSAVVEPSQDGTDDGYSVRNSIVSDFTMGLYLGGNGGTIERNKFVDNMRFPGSIHAVSNGDDIYSDYTYPTKNAMIQDNVFANPDSSAVDFEGKEVGAVIQRNVIDTPDPGLDAGSTGMYMFGVQNISILNNGIFNAPTDNRTRSGLRFANAQNVGVVGNTLVGFRYGIAFSDFGIAPGPTTGWDGHDNRIYNNTIGIAVHPDTSFAAGSILANDNWWGANGGPGSIGARTLPPNPNERSRPHSQGALKGAKRARPRLKHAVSYAVPHATPYAVPHAVPIAPATAPRMIPAQPRPTAAKPGMSVVKARNRAVQPRSLPAKRDKTFLGRFAKVHPRSVGPVNGIQVYDANGDPVANTGQVVADTWLHLTCSLGTDSVPQGTNTDATGAVTGMPVVNHPLGSVHYQPIMDAAVTGGTLAGFGVVPNPGAVLTGTLTAGNTLGPGDFDVALDAEQVSCPFKVVVAPPVPPTPPTPTPTPSPAPEREHHHRHHHALPRTGAGDLPLAALTAAGAAVSGVGLLRSNRRSQRRR